MIGRIRGILIEKQAPLLLVEVGGVGYEILAPMTTIYQLPEIGQESILYTHLIVREDAHLLYGFQSKTDRKLFQELIKVNGIGAKMALAILSGMDADTILSCIKADDSALLVSIPGIGKKTAERLIVEMRDKIPQITLSLSEINTDIATKALTDSPQSNVATHGTSSLQTNEATEALIALGYRKNEAQKAVFKIKDSSDTTEGLIKSALKELMRH
ncbi:Holliday junction branch migration protein RuvA [Thiotrichales bacterium 19S3-7]|nr:Holliday junction branch migration protein RuvA [Thiotrichales bacterium 19S3-7]MCF6801206.1 Holliday junction branch migration protein RuvA [Thiotrichales bacterium 19S3-11]